MARKIAFYDSGIGGLTVLREFIALNPDVDEIIYIGDAAYMPYGLKTADFIAERMEKIASFLYRQQCDAIVLACHTASAVWLDRKLNMLLPIVDAIRPTADYILKQCDNRNVIVFATQLTTAMGSYQSLLEELGHNAVFISSKFLAQQIEDGKKAIITEFFGIMPNNQLETVIVLACTHFLFAKQEIQHELMKCNTSSDRQNRNVIIKIFDPAKVIAIEAEKQFVGITQDHNQSKVGERLAIKIYVTGTISDNLSAKVYATLGNHDIKLFPELNL